MNSTITTTHDLSVRYLSARADLAAAETAYLATAVAWSDAIGSGACSARALLAASGHKATDADGHAYVWLGHLISETDPEARDLPETGILALQADIRAVYRGKGAGSKALARIREDLAGREIEPTVSEVAEILAREAGKARRTTTEAGKGKGSATETETETEATVSDRNGTRTVSAILADILADLARVSQRADEITADDALALAIVEAAVEDLLDSARVKA